MRIGDHVRMLHDFDGVPVGATGVLIPPREKFMAEALGRNFSVIWDDPSIKEGCPEAPWGESYFEMIPMVNCPECGAEFELKDHYLCSDCRQK